MPIIGVVCPVTGEAVDTNTCLSCSLDKPKYHLQCGCDTIVLADMLKNRDVKGLSMSEITTDFLRKTLLSRMVDYYITPSNGYYSIRGKWIHESKSKVYLSPDFGNITREMRFVHPKFGISGQVDCYYNNQRRLVDYKTSSRLPDQIRPAHIRQLNGYVELLRANDMSVDSAYITYMTYSKHLRVPVEIWERSKTQDMLRDLIEFFDECIENREVPPRNLCAEGAWYMCRFCPFNDMCKEHSGWWTVPEEMTNYEWRVMKLNA